MSLNSNTESIEELLAKANALPTADEVYAQGYNAALMSLADRPIEIGTEESTDYPGTWYWEKHDSGKAVCWGAFSVGTVNVSTAWGDLYDSGDGVAYSKSLPAGLFVAAPDNVDLTIQKSDSALFVSRFDGAKASITKDNIGTFTFSRPTSRTVNNVYIGVRAIGRWK